MLVLEVAATTDFALLRLALDGLTAQSGEVLNLRT